MLSCNQSRFTLGLLHAVFVGLDHLLDHLAADRAGLAAGKVAVIAVLQIDADFGGGLHLELVHRLARIGVHDLVTGSVRHSLHLLFIRLVRIRKAYSLVHVFQILAVLIFCEVMKDMQIIVHVKNGMNAIIQDE